MGFRTVVVLNNDQSHEWQKDPLLGQKIWHAASCLFSPRDAYCDRLQYGQVIEQVHADTQTLAVLDGYGGKAVAWTHWNRGQSDETRNLALLKDLADKMGYRISKKSVKSDKAFKVVNAAGQSMDTIEQ